MIILLHVLIALTSIAYTTYMFFAPSLAKLRASYSLIALTLLSGSYLVWSTHAALLQACTTGLVYVGVVSVGVIATHRKLAAITAGK